LELHPRGWGIFRNYGPSQIGLQVINAGNVSRESFLVNGGSGGLSTGYGVMQAGITGTSSETGTYFNNTATGGRSYNIFSSSNGSGVGGGNFIIGDATAGVTRLKIDASGGVTIPSLSTKGVATTDANGKLGTTTGTGALTNDGAGNLTWVVQPSLPASNAMLYTQADDQFYAVTTGSGISFNPSTGILSSTGSGGTVTMVGASTGMSFTTITGAGVVAIDTTKVPYLYRGSKEGVLYHNGTQFLFYDTTHYALRRTQTSGTVTSVATGFGLTGGTITTTGTLKADTSAIATRPYVYNGFQQKFGSQTANTFYAAPNGSSGVPSFRAIFDVDIPSALTGKTYNGMSITANSGTFAVGNAKSAIISNTLTFTGTDGSTVNVGAGGTVLYGNQTITASGDATGSGTTSLPLTLATVNSNVGTFGSATQSLTATVNAKGLVTAISAQTVTPAIGSITGLGTGVATALGVNIGTSGAFVTNGGALGTPSSGVGTNLTGTASALNIGGSAGSVANALSISAELISGGASSYNGSAAKSIGIQSASVTNAMLAGSIAASKLAGGIDSTKIASVGYSELPTSGASNGQVLTYISGTGWRPTTQSGGGSGIVSSGTSGQLAYYASTGTTVSGLTPPIIPTASSVVAQDANKNYFANNVTEGYTTIATAGGTTTLTVSSAYLQKFTGSANQTVTLPVASTMSQLGQGFFIKNESSGTVIVQSSGGNTVATLVGSSSYCTVFAALLSGTSAASWSAYGSFGLGTFGAALIPFGLSTGGLMTDALFSWDDPNKRLGIGTGSPSYAIDVTAGSASSVIASITNTNNNSTSNAYLQLVNNGGNKAILMKPATNYSGAANIPAGSGIVYNIVQPLELVCTDASAGYIRFWPQNVSSPVLGITSTSAIFADGMNVVVGTSTGTKYGTSTSQKQSWWNATPVIQQTGSVVDALVTMGLIASPTTIKATHIIGTTSAPTIAAGAGAGTSPTVSLTNATDLSGIINITTGTLPSGSSTVVTITFNTAYGQAPNISLTPNNAGAAALSGVTMVYPSTTTTTLVINAGATGLTAATTYQWFYTIIQ